MCRELVRLGCNRVDMIYLYDSHAGHCDIAVPTCSCPEITLPATLFPHTSSIFPSHPLSSWVVNNRRHAVTDNTWGSSLGLGLLHGCTPIRVRPVMMTHCFSIMKLFYLFK